MNRARDQFLSGSGLPEMRTVESVGATFATCASTLLSAGEEPTITSNIEE